ncbi:hypothetical protein O6H91_18G079900 [Diphasiastrum complanatum]|uniref:Uncharacterized protein n=10 Tax=Diphasiastrum complanatum TaxID=34168 RepID=A0ACC2B2Z3_DIPCM|nr:hypothetical protein O6H91_18G079900 [Diphasiastrum complanatum]
MAVANSLMVSMQCDNSDLPSTVKAGNKAVEISNHQIPREAYGVLHRLAGRWPDIPDGQDLTITRMKGAMTNQVYECLWKRGQGKRPRKVLVRIYGENNDFLFKREDEILTFELMSKHRQGPLLLARFPNGRVEEFLKARTLSAADLRDPEISVSIAVKLREFHQLSMPGPQEPKIWQRLRDWLAKALEVGRREHNEEFQLNNLGHEISELERKLSKSDQVLGFCHNDLQYGNIMMNEDDGSITLIDYEYATYNPIAFDIANHFCEMTANYHSETPHLLDQSKYPDFEEQCRFIEAYLQSSGESVSQFQVETLVRETDAYSLASHLHWGLWGIISASFSEIDFDFEDYARQRFQQYHEKKSFV